MRVAHVGTGATGREALRGIIAHPGLELVEPSGWRRPTRWAATQGELVGVDPVGSHGWWARSPRRSTAAPDVLSYCAQRPRPGSRGGRRGRARARARRRRHHHLAARHALPARGPRMSSADPLEAAAAAGRLDLPVDRLGPRVLQRSAAHGVVDHVGLGRARPHPGDRHLRPLRRPARDPRHHGLRPAAHLCGADRHRGRLRRLLGADGASAGGQAGPSTLDEVVGTDDFAVHDRDLDTSVGVMEAGAVVARRVACEGRVAGRAVITAEHITRMAADVAPHWPAFDGVG